MLKLIDNNNITDPAINLSLEEYCVRNLDMKFDYMLFYINEPSVIIGKHQNTLEEINTDYIRENNIHVIRRISGGGAVYHDFGNLNFSFLTKHSNESIHNFRFFTGPVIRLLNELGVNAELNGRNDITVGEKKISGNAQFTDTKSMFSHGTLLFDSDIKNVVRALNVKPDKIESKGIKSVKSRVANIKEFINIEMSVLEFKDALIKSIFSDTAKYPVYRLSDKEWDAVYALADSKYKNWGWNYGRSPEFNIQKVKRFSFGQIDARINVKNGIIEEIKFYGDFLGHGELTDIENHLKGNKYEAKTLGESLEIFDMRYYFGDISHEEFLDFLI